MGQLRTAFVFWGDRPLSLHFFFHGAQQRLLPIYCADPAALRARSIRPWGGQAQVNFFRVAQVTQHCAPHSALRIFSTTAFWQHCGEL
ncbi:hypothetical protein NDU88_004061 [Pleurodeles waltl]|uniref:Uncharacterized protein n=1 Tax=Pleurodeles waltl TaxID=8319 RepID=A0AAV7VJ51_PLEWA|nr:hypothetical protein NDU88_004061 [Pleurodeles waltl]